MWTKESVEAMLADSAALQSAHYAELQRKRSIRKDKIKRGVPMCRQLQLTR